MGEEFEVGKVRLEGMPTGAGIQSPDTVLARLNCQRGTVVDRTAITQDCSRLYETGMFKSVKAKASFLGRVGASQSVERHAELGDHGRTPQYAATPAHMPTSAPGLNSHRIHGRAFPTNNAARTHPPTRAQVTPVKKGGSVFNVTYRVVEKPFGILKDAEIALDGAEVLPRAGEVLTRAPGPSRSFAIPLRTVQLQLQLWWRTAAAVLQRWHASTAGNAALPLAALPAGMRAARALPAIRRRLPAAYSARRQPGSAPDLPPPLCGVCAVRAEVTRKLRRFVGKPITQRTLGVVRSTVDGWYRRRGYDNSGIQTFTGLESGSLGAKINEIKVVGMTIRAVDERGRPQSAKVDAAYLWPGVVVRRGGLYNSNDIQDSFQNILALGLHDQVGVSSSSSSSSRRQRMHAHTHSPARLPGSSRPASRQ